MVIVKNRHLDGFNGFRFLLGNVDERIRHFWGVGFLTTLFTDLGRYVLNEKVVAVVVINECHFSRFNFTAAKDTSH